jgi:hypothetical protein
VRVYTLGPPHSEKHLRRLNSSSETYSFAEAAFFATASIVEDTDPDDDDHQPFEPNHRIGLKEAEGLGADNSVLGAFFQRYYFGLDPCSAEPEQRWRRIDSDWLGAAQHQALKLDNATNNTSLVLAIELSPGGKVLLFAADAQVGSWQSWQDLHWTIDGKNVTGPDLLKRTVFYKVGHHGSHNATLRQRGLELMAADGLVAFVPVDESMARQFGWGRMPLTSLMSALAEQAGGRAVRTDRAYDHAPGSDPSWLRTTDLYYEFVVTL